MKVLFTFIFFIFSTQTSVCQSILCGAGVNLNHYRNQGGSNYYFEGKSGYLPGYSINIHRIKIKDSIFWPFRNIELFAMYTSGNMKEYMPGGAMTSSYLDVKISRTLIGFGMYPINPSFFKKKLQFAFGGFVNYMIAGKVTGQTSETRMGNDSTHGSYFYDFSEHFHNQPTHYNQQVAGGLSAMLSYKLIKFKNWEMLPSLGMRYYLSPDFSRLANLNLVQYSFSLLFSRGLKLNKR